MLSLTIIGITIAIDLILFGVYMEHYKQEQIEERRKYECT